jgi:hypothetical protein
MAVGLSVIEQEEKAELIGITSGNLPSQYLSQNMVNNRAINI